MPTHTKQSSIQKPLQSVFLKHPESIGESYLEHQRAAMGFAMSLAIASVAAFIHALVPCLCETTARKRIRSLNNQLQQRVCADQCNEISSAE